MPNSRSVAKMPAADTAHDDNIEVSNDDFKMMIDKKLNELKSTIISELTKNLKVLIQSEFQNITQEYKDQLEEVRSTEEMLQQLLTNLKQENLYLKEKSRKDQEDLEKYCKENEQYSRSLCLRIKNIKK